MPDHYIHCRAKLTPTCYDGQPSATQFGDDIHQKEDGTWEDSFDDPRGTIVCDDCYVRLMPFTRSGSALLHEIPDAIEVYRSNLAEVKKAGSAEDLAQLRAKAEENMATSRPGSPLYESARACRFMVDEEMLRRG